MKIPNALLQFATHRSLFVVTGTQEADFYVAYQGEIQKVKTFVLEKPTYSDREYVGRRSGGAAYESGSIAQAIKRSMQRDFITHLSDALKELQRESFEHVYVFCPATVHNDVEGAIPATLRKKVVRVWKGNYHKQTPIDLIKKITA